jgi:thiol:disulfide interchange protein/DsbC/DsbD-like thiol-disulfide interchange protein
MMHALARGFGACLLLVACGAARAAESDVATSPRATVSLVSETDAVAPGQDFRVGLRMRVAPGWHTYWRNPGDAGAPAELNFELPAGMVAGPPSWPVPKRQIEGPLVTYGYEGEVLLPVVMAGGVAGPIVLRASWLVCEKICVPEEAEFTLNLPAGIPGKSPQAPLFAAADAQVPVASPFQAMVSGDGVLSVRGVGLNAGSVRDAWFMPLAWGQVEHSAPQRLAVGPDGFTLALRPGPQFDSGRGLSGVLVVQDPSGQEARLAIEAAPGAAMPPARTMWWQVLGLAFLGGLVLNLMPCVFPVLAIKAVGLARLSGVGRRVALAQAASYAAGVVATFMLVAGALLLARAAGAAAGWGFQFQSPVFVAGMAWLLFAVGLNLSGVFSVGGRLAGAGQGLAGQGGHVGSFATGALAVLVATPCTAPFMGAAIAAALAAPPAATLAVFAVMGLGLAAPYVLLAAVPAVARAMPRPGAWMDVLKQALAFPMYGASIWLLWVASQQSGPDGVLATAAGFVLVGFAGWAAGLAQAGRFPRIAWTAALAACIGAAAVLSTVTTAAAETRAEVGVERFSTGRLAELRAEGQPVFVNMTASWCVTCLVNERVVLSSGAVRQAFAQRGVTYLKGDWTRQDAEITAFLRSQGRDGVPLYVMYPPAGGSPTVLPQILTESLLVSELGCAGGS